MHRLTIITLVVAVVLLFTGCTAGKSISEGAAMSEITFQMESLDYIADARFEAVLAAIKDKDSSALKAMFSQKALAEAENIDAGIDFLFGLIQGDIVSWERETLGSDDSVRSGKVSRVIRSWYQLTTTENTYLFFLSEYDKDEIDPSNQGLYVLRGIKEENATTQWGDWLDMNIPGVYMP